MAKITLKGNPVNTIGELPEVGTQVPDFELIANDLSTKTLADYAGKKKVLNIFPSLDTGTCAMSVRNFNAKAAGLDDTVVLCISRDLPFAQARFCGTEGIDNAVTLSDFADGSFGKNYNLTIADGPLAHLHSRAVIVLDENNKVIYTQQVPEIVDEPDYDAAIAAL